MPSKKSMLITAAIALGVIVAFMKFPQIRKPFGLS